MRALVLACAVGLLSLSSVARAAPGPAPVLVVLGGWGSCDGSNRPQRHTIDGFVHDRVLEQQLSAGVTLRWVVGCFDQQDALHVTDDSGPYLVHSPTTFAGFYQEVATRAAGGPVFVVGHSHGGWLALDLVQHAPVAMNLVGLVTIDPISYRRCAPDLFIRSVLGQLLRGNGDPGCLASPPDQRSYFSQIASRVGHAWWQLYQTTDPVLHADRSFAAAEDIVFGYADSRPGQAHLAIGRDEYRVWLLIADHIREQLAAALAP